MRPNGFSSDAQRLLLLQTCFERRFGAGLFERLRALRSARHKSGQRLDAQAAIQIRSQQSPHPSHVFAAALHAIFSTPQRDYCHETSFVVCDHDETSGETGDFSERSIDRRGQSGVDLMCFIWFRHELDAESCNPRTGVAHTECPRISTQSVRIKWPRYRIRKTVGLQRVGHGASGFNGPPLFRGEAHPRGSRSDSDAPWWDTRGTGEPSLRSRTPKYSMGSYNRVVQRACISFHGFDSKREPLLPVEGAAILVGNKTEGYVELFAFTREYVERLREGDPSTELHFVTYFDQLLRIKLRARMLASETVEDLRQETYIRVLVTLRKDGIRQPERFGAFVNSTCNYVLQEFYRASSRTSPWDDSYLEMPDHAVNVEGLLVTKQMKDRVREVIEELPKKDRDLLRAFFLEEKDKDEVCRQFGVERDYLRVLLHRAKDKFRVLYEKDREGPPGRLSQGEET
jgi:RNA polymerase sigma-70 factor (ECF subfamily)